MTTAPWNRFQMRPLTAEERKANGVGRPAALETAATVDSGHEPMTGLKDSLDQAIASVKSYLHALAQAKEEALKAAMPFKSSPTLQPGDLADMWHEGTRKFYRVLVEFQVTEEEATRG